jgi:hypothetical protein
MTDINDDKVEELAEGIPAITTEKAEILGQYIMDKIEKIVADYKMHS